LTGTDIMTPDDTTSLSPDAPTSAGDASAGDASAGHSRSTHLQPFASRHPHMSGRTFLIGARAPVRLMMDYA
jgi:hypothetical protein